MRLTIFISLIGLLLLGLFCFFISHLKLKPLQHLIDTAHRMAEGQLDEPVKESRRTDEVGYVQNTFREMQQSIGQHIAHITQLTDVLRQRNDDLKLAYEHRMEQSVKAIHATVDDFRQHIADMDANECRHMAEKIGTHTETTTELLGNLLDIADRKKEEHP